MNRRIRKKKRKRFSNFYTNKRQRDANKALCKRYPFLIPRDGWRDSAEWMRKPYDWTLVESFPRGWWKAFGIMLCEEVREECLKYNYLYELRFEEVKEKFGLLRIYTNGVPRESKIDSIIEDYSCLSENICMGCGRPDIHMLNYGGWLMPYCRDCFSKILDKNKRKESYEEFVCKNDNGRMADVRRYTTYRNEGITEVTVDISSKAEKIRARWRVGE